MIDRRRLEPAAAEYRHLRGLFGIPLSLLFVLAALGNEGWGPLRHAWVFLVGVALIGLACLAVHLFYERYYGRVSLSARQQRRAAIAAVAVAPPGRGGRCPRLGTSWSSTGSSTNPAASRS